MSARITDYGAAAEKVAYDLMGTCQNLDAVLERYDFDGFDEVSDFCYRLDSLVWECKGCGWWLEPCEIDEDDFCDQCRDDSDAD